MDDLKDVARRALARQGKFIAMRWRLQEYTPSYESSGYYGSTVSEKVVKEYMYYIISDAEEDFLSYVPAKGNRVRLTEEKCYEKTVTHWSTPIKIK